MIDYLFIFTSVSDNNLKFLTSQVQREQFKEDYLLASNVSGQVFFNSFLNGLLSQVIIGNDIPLLIYTFSHISTLL